MMNVLIWKKCREVRRSPARIAALVLLAAGMALLFAYVSGLEPEVIAWAFPISICFMASAAFMNVDDIAQAILYRAMGIGARKLWMCNWLFTALSSFLLSGLILLVYGLSASWDLESALVINYALSLPTVLMLTSLSTIHYRGNTKGEVAVASVFSIINLAMISLPFVLSLTGIDRIVIVIVASLSLLLFCASLLYFIHDRGEEIVRNTERFAMIYDEKFFGDD